MCVSLGDGASLGFKVRLTRTVKCLALAIS